MSVLEVAVEAMSFERMRGVARKAILLFIQGRRPYVRFAVNMFLITQPMVPIFDFWKGISFLVNILSNNSLTSLV